MKIVTDQGHDYRKTSKYQIRADRGIHKGIFFRKPIQKMQINIYGDGSFSGRDHHIYNYIRRLKNPIFRWYQYILGNKESIRQIKMHIDEVGFYGVTINVLCSSIYFKREYRELDMICFDHPAIERIHAYGYESPFENVSGHCAKEVATIYYRDGWTSGVISYKDYDLTYISQVLKFVGYTRDPEGVVR